MRFGFVDEQERHETFAPFFARGRKNLAHHPFRFAHPHVEDLRAFDVHEIFAHLRAGFFAELLRQIVRRSPCRSASCRSPAGRRAENPSAWRAEISVKRSRCNSGSSIASLIALQRLFLSADFFPRQLRHRVEVMFVATWCWRASRAPCGNWNRPGLRRPISSRSGQDRTSAAAPSIATRAPNPRAIGLCRSLR